MQTAALCIKNTFPSHHINIILCVGQACCSPQTIEETEMNGKSHGIMSQCGVF